MQRGMSTDLGVMYFRQMDKVGLSKDPLLQEEEEGEDRGERSEVLRLLQLGKTGKVWTKTVGYAPIHQLPKASLDVLLRPQPLPSPSQRSVVPISSVGTGSLFHSALQEPACGREQGCLQR